MPMQSIEIDGFKCNPATGKPLGRPPKDPARKAAWDAVNARAISTAPAQPRMQSASSSAVPLPAIAYVDDPNVTDEEIIDRVSDRFRVMQSITEGACEGNIRGVIISGAGGVGKTHTVEEIVERYRDNEGVRVEVQSGVISPPNLYMMLWRGREENSVTVLDDMDGVFYNEESLSLLKAALDSGKKRNISWMKQSPALADAGIPNKFEFKGTIIFLTNVNFQGIVDLGKGSLVPHLQALMTRVLYLDLRLHAPREVGLWVDYMVTENNILVKDGLTPKQQDDVLEFIALHRNQLRSLSIRTALKIASLLKAAKPGHDWRVAAQTLEFR